MDEQLEAIVKEVQKGSKYRSVHEDLVRNIAAIEIKKGRSNKETIKAVRNKIHQVGSAYQPLGIDYNQLINQLQTLPKDMYDPRVKEFCREAMGLHASTRERLDILETFYSTCLSNLTPIHSLLDLACGLNPLTLPWIPIRKDAKIFACDIYTDQIDFLNQFFSYFNIQGKAFCCDLTQEIPALETQITFILKTIPCLEQIDKHIGQRLLSGIQSKYLLISFPAQSLGGRDKGMRLFYSKHFQSLIQNQDWSVQSYSFSNEEAYLVEK
ncbi:MAG: class I SAM-dependent methyltransferase [Anaerolineaceae bacterium]